MIRIKLFFKTLISRIKQLVFEFKQMQVVLYGCLLSMQLAASGNGNTPNSIFDVMGHREVLRLTLETDIEKLKSDIANEEYQSASLRFKDATGTEQAWKLKVKLRGKFRRMKCVDVPPLKLNFSKRDLEMAGLAPFDDLKLVPQCVEDEALAADYLKREYLAYRLFNEVSPYSYRVQLLRITYIDTATGKRQKQWAFLIEDTAQLRARIGAEKCKDCYNLPNEAFHLQATRLVSVYQYLIGNIDWSLAKMRNVKLFKVNGKVVPVPYDFDFTGLVNAGYMRLDPALGIAQRRDRVYLGLPENVDELGAAIYVISAHREKMEALIGGAKFLSYDSRIDMEAYLNSFFGKPEITKFAPEAIVEGKIDSLDMDK